MALTPAEKQRRYRERKAKQTVTLPREEYEAMQSELEFLRDTLAEQSGWTEAIRGMNGSWGQRQPLQYTHWLFSIEIQVDQLLRRQHSIGILDKRYAPVREAYTQAITESFRDGAFPITSNVTNNDDKTV
jgi:hypothetical protein